MVQKKTIMFDWTENETKTEASTSNLTAPVCLRPLTETQLISDLSNHWLRGNAVTIGQDLPLNTNNGEASHSIVHTLV